MKTYRTDIEILSPVHIGTGDELMPLQYKIEKETFYQFTLEDVYPRWAEDVQMQFLQLVEQNDLIRLRRFVTEHLKPEQANYSMAVTSGVEQKYNDKLNDPENQLLIAPFIRTGTDFTPYIPGSSLKGALRTGVINGLAIKKNLPEEKANKKNFEFIVLDAQDKIKDRWRTDIKKDPFRAIKIADVFLPDAAMMVGEIVNCGKNPRSGRIGFKPMQMFKEVLLGRVNGVSAVFKTEIRLDDHLFSTRAFNRKVTIDDILDMCRQFYQSELQREIDFYSSLHEVAKISHSFLNEPLKDNQAVVRLGRFSGIYAVTVNRYRKPQHYRKGWGKTRNLFDGRYPMGWIKVTVHR